MIITIITIITSAASFQATEELGYQRDRARHHEVGPAPLSAMVGAQVLRKGSKFGGRE